MSAQCPQTNVETMAQNPLPPTGPAISQQRTTRSRAPSDQWRTDAATRMPLVWSGKANTREAELYRRVVRQLVAHVGGKATHAQELLIGRIAWLSVHLARMDQRILESGDMSEHTGKQYLAWNNSIARGLVALGLEAAPPPRRSLLERLRDAAAPDSAPDITGPPGPVQQAAPSTSTEAAP